MPRSRALIAGNWKMNGTRPSLSTVSALREAAAAGRLGGVDALLCPPATLLAAAAALCAGTALAVGGQDCSPHPDGAHTGDLSAEMLKDAGATAVIVGHSERRHGHGEADALVQLKAAAALRAGLLAIICVGETRAEHDRGETLRVVGRQIDSSVPAGAGPGAVVLAYEPVWAIGTGLTPTEDGIAGVHSFMRRRLATAMGANAAGVRLLYGGSVKPDNAAAVLALPDVDGVLVGGASLKADDFLAIAAAR